MICSSLDIYYYYYTSKTSSPSPSSHFYVPPNYNSPLSTKFYPNYCVNVSPRLFYHNDFWIHPGFILGSSWIHPGFFLDSSWIIWTIDGKVKWLDLMYYICTIILLVHNHTYYTTLLLLYTSYNYCWKLLIDRYIYLCIHLYSILCQKGYFLCFNCSLNSVVT